MTSKTLTISLSEEDLRYIKEDNLLSPSHIFQVALHNIKENRESLRERIKILQELLRQKDKFIFDNNLQDEFNDWSRKQ